eukprot:TRINITY_DN15259_c0_g1_i1.p1 TRINITY_DN15259_c0_g1~~TRINITY_DN15259_c0_g1_i1.p1  ORF type:complete len:159 (+),score=23.88 TRINITY_DN15259_c0_g1_i1:43-519(+)
MKVWLVVVVLLVLVCTVYSGCSDYNNSCSSCVEEHRGGDECVWCPSGGAVATGYCQNMKSSFCSNPQSLSCSKDLLDPQSSGKWIIWVAAAVGLCIIFCPILVVLVVVACFGWAALTCGRRNNNQHAQYVEYNGYGAAQPVYTQVQPQPVYNQGVEYR